MNKTTRNYVFAAGLFLLFAVFTFMVAKVDVKSVLVTNIADAEAQKESISIGFASINEAVRDCFAFNKTWYTITKLTGAVAILFAGLFALLGLAQLVKGKSLAKVDKDIYALAITYLVVVILYVIFEKLEVNFRPVDLGEGLEASYPSTHTMLALSIFGTAMIQFKNRLKNGNIRLAAQILTAVLLAVTVVGRLISGVHWFTDIIGGIILGGAIIMLYYAMQYSIEVKRRNGEK